MMKGGSGWRGGEREGGFRWWTDGVDQMMASLVKEEKDPTSLLATLPLSAAVQSANPHETFQPIDCFQCSSSDMYMHICTYERVCVCVQSCKSFFLAQNSKEKSLEFWKCCLTKWYHFILVIFYHFIRYIRGLKQSLTKTNEWGGWGEVCVWEEEEGYDEGWWGMTTCREPASNWEHNNNIRERGEGLSARWQQY